MIEGLQLSRTVAPAPGVEEVPSLRIVVPQLQGASVRDDDAAVLETCRPENLVEKIALAFVGAADGHGGLLGQAPACDRALRTGTRAVAT